VTARYVLAPEAALDVIQIWRYIRKQGSLEMADHVESVIREKIVFPGTEPGRRTLAQGSDTGSCEVLSRVFLFGRLSA